MLHTHILCFFKGHTGKRLEMGATDRRIITALKVFSVIFASLGLGEAVCRVLFFDFDGATDRWPIELVFGFTFCLRRRAIGREALTKVPGQVDNHRCHSEPQQQDPQSG